MNTNTIAADTLTGLRAIGVDVDSDHLIDTDPLRTVAPGWAFANVVADTRRYAYGVGEDTDAHDYLIDRIQSAAENLTAAEVASLIMVAAHAGRDGQTSEWLRHHTWCDASRNAR